jgi:hypothetical protein
MIILTSHINPINNGIEFPLGYVLPESNTYTGLYSDETTYCTFETVEERAAFYAEHGLPAEFGISAHINKKKI